MGNEESRNAVGPAVAPLQSQDSNSPWTVLCKDTEDGKVCEFSHLTDGSFRDDLCKTALEHLRILRHPNVLKFLGSETCSERIVMTTEVVVPLLNLTDDLQMEVRVLGWKDVLLGLDFLHTRAKLSHNNLHTGCVYVGAVNNRWKLGGLECAQLHSKIDAVFLSSIATYRHLKAIPPEDKAPTMKPSVPCHSRDIWACGQLMLDLPKGTSGLGTSILRYVQEEMLNHDPQVRPSALAVSQQVWMKSDVGAIADFLTNLTLHSTEDKDIFFSSLLDRLRPLPPKMVAELIMPLLLTPLIVSETAHYPFWSAVLTPGPPLATMATLEHPSDASLPPSLKPLFTQELFVAHVISVLLNLLESRDKQVRFILLKYLGAFAPLCTSDDLKTIVLPEVLVGLRDSCDELVSSTLHALGDLVPLIGAKAVVGTPGKAIFAGSLPWGKILNMETTSISRSVSMETSESTIGANGPSKVLSSPITPGSSDVEGGATPSETFSNSKRQDRANREHQRERRERLKVKAQAPLKLATRASLETSVHEGTPAADHQGTPAADQQGSDISEGLWPSSADQLHSGGVQDGYQEGLSGILTGQSKTCHDEGSSLDDDGVSFDDEGKSLDDERVSIDDEGKSLDDTEQSLEMEPVDLHKVDKPECLPVIRHEGSQSHFSSGPVNGFNSTVDQNGYTGLSGSSSRSAGQEGSSRSAGQEGSSRSAGQDGSSRSAGQEGKEQLELKAMLWPGEPDVFAELGMAPSIQPASVPLPNQRGVTTALTYQATSSEPVGEEWGGGWEDWGNL